MTMTRTLKIPLQFRGPVRRRAPVRPPCHRRSGAPGASKGTGGGTSGGDQQARRSRLCDPQHRRPDGPPRSGGTGRSRPAADRRRAHRRLRPISRARPAERLQRSTDQGRDARGADRRNDRLRTVAYSFFEHNPERAMVSPLLTALDKEQAEFVRPALVRALAALARTLSAPASMFEATRVQQALVRDVSRGEDFFRSVVIEALGDYKAAYAFDAITTSATLEGPLQDDAALALGKIGDKRALETLAGLQRTAARSTQPSIAAANCLPARELPQPPKLSDGNAEVRRQERRLPGSASRRRHRPRRPRRRGPGRGRRRAARDRHSLAGRCDALADCAGAGRRGPAEYGARDADAREVSPERSGDRAARRGVRHARGRPRQGAVLRVRPPHVLGRRQGSPTGRRRRR